MHEDQKYIEGLVANDSGIIKQIYTRFVPKVTHFIVTNNGSTDDAEDVVQEVLITLYNQAKTESFVLTCPFDAYFFLLCKRKWLNALKKKTIDKVTIDHENVYKDDSIPVSVLETDLFSQKEALFYEMLGKIGDSCKELLLLSFTLSSMEEVAVKLQTTYAYVRKRKSICIGKLTELIQSSNLFKQLKK